MKNRNEDNGGLGNKQVYLLIKGKIILQAF